MINQPDRRVRRTRDAIEASLLSLVAEKGYETVTVREIIDRADVGRSTFYAHYTDKQDLLRACLDRIEQVLTPSGGTADSTTGFSPGLFAGIAEHRDLYRALTPARSASAFVQARVQKLLADALRERLTAQLPTEHTTPVPVEVAIHAIVGAYLALLSGWLNGDVGSECSSAEMENNFLTIADPAIAAALDLPTSSLQ